MPEEIAIVAATADDARIAAEITREAFTGVSIDQAIEDHLGLVAGMSWQDVKADEVRREIQEHPENCFVARSAGRVVGYVTTQSAPAIRRGVICNVAVDKAYRGRGIGRRLIQRALDHFRRGGLTHAKIETLTVNPVGQQLYPALGFEEVARQIHYVVRLSRHDENSE